MALDPTVDYAALAQTLIAHATDFTGDAATIDSLKADIAKATSDAQAATSSDTADKATIADLTAQLTSVKAQLDAAQKDLAQLAPLGSILVALAKAWSLTIPTLPVPPVPTSNVASPDGSVTPTPVVG
jgi:hypothetical protein